MEQIHEDPWQDAPAHVTTPYTLTLNSLGIGRYSWWEDPDWWRIELEAGQTYVFTVTGRGGSQTSVHDPILALYDENRQLITWNDDVDFEGGNLYPAITYTPTISANYYLEVDAWDHRVANYVLQVASDIYTPEQVALQLMHFGWGVGTPWSYRTTSIPVNLDALDERGARLATLALEAWSVTTGLSFFLWESEDHYGIRFDDAENGAFSQLTQRDELTGRLAATSVNVGPDWFEDFGGELNTETFLTYLHEVGHALGFYHAGPYNGAGITLADRLYRNDSTQITVMSYFSAAENPDVTASYFVPVTPMIGDLVAIEYGYGWGGTVFHDNTVWGARSNVGGYLGRIFSYLFGEASPDPGEWAAPSSIHAVPVGMTIRDTGGVDRLDLSPVTADQRIDLRPGAVSDAWGGIGNLILYHDTVIEHLRTGSGNDLIIGNFEDNRLEAGVGRDTIRAGDGNDQVLGQGGDDLLYGEAGNDNIAASDGNDTVYGGDGNDSIGGGLGNDLLHGDEGNDTIGGGQQNDTLHGGDGRDLLSGGPGHDRIFGGADGDTIASGEGNDLAEGGTGNDDMGGGPGNDTLDGGAGNDTLGGGMGNDLLTGGDGHDFVAAGEGADTLFGGAGNDTLNGGPGDDLLTGGAGADLFVFNLAAVAGPTTDRILDFQDGLDRIRLDGVAGATAADRFAALEIAATGGGSMVRIGHQTILVDLLPPELLGVGDFVFT